MRKLFFALKVIILVFLIGIFLYHTPAARMYRGKTHIGELYIFWKTNEILFDHLVEELPQLDDLDYISISTVGIKWTRGSSADAPGEQIPLSPELLEQLEKLRQSPEFYDIWIHKDSINITGYSESRRLIVNIEYCPGSIETSTCRGAAFDLYYEVLKENWYACVELI